MYVRTRQTGERKWCAVCTCIGQWGQEDRLVETDTSPAFILPFKSLHNRQNGGLRSGQIHTQEDGPEKRVLGNTFQCYQGGWVWSQTTSTLFSTNMSSQQKAGHSTPTSYHVDTNPPQKMRLGLQWMHTRTSSWGSTCTRLPASQHVQGVLWSLGTHTF